MARIMASHPIGQSIPYSRGGKPPVCSNPTDFGPSCSNTCSQSPIVYGSRSTAAATSVADHPCASSHNAYHHSLSRGFLARYTRSRTPDTSGCHRVSDSIIALTSMYSYPIDPASIGPDEHTSTTAQFTWHSL